jgi:hypothetical protein
MQPAIVNDYASIAQRMTQLEQERIPPHRADQFSIPNGVVILLDADVVPGLRRPPCDLLVILHEMRTRLYLHPQPAGTDSGTQESQHQSLRDWSNYLHQFYPSARLISTYEMTLSREDSNHLAARLKALR